MQRLAIAVDALENGRFEEAVSILEELVEVNAEDPDILMYLGIAYVQNEQPQDALDILEKAKDLVEDHCVLYLFLGRAQKSLQKLDEAERSLLKAIKLDSLQPEAWEDLAGVLYARGKYAETVETIEDATVYFPDTISLRALNAMAFNRLGDRTAAAAEWEYIHKLQPDSSMGIINYAYTLLMLGKYTEATPIIEKAVELVSSDYKTWVLKAELEIQKQDYESALQHIQRSYQLKPTCTHTLGRLAVIQNKLGLPEYEETLHKFEKEISYQTQAWRGFYYVYKHLNMVDEMLDSLQAGTKDDCYAAAPWVALATEYNELGMHEESLEAWRSAIRLRNYIKVHCHQCDKFMRIPSKNKGNVIKLPETVRCNGCHNPVHLPEGFAIV